MFLVCTHTDILKQSIPRIGFLKNQWEKKIKEVVFPHSQEVLIKFVLHVILMNLLHTTKTLVTSETSLGCSFRPSTTGSWHLYWNIFLRRQEKWLPLCDPACVFEQLCVVVVLLPWAESQDHLKTIQPHFVFICHSSDLLPQTVNKLCRCYHSDVDVSLTLWLNVLPPL